MYFNDILIATKDEVTHIETVREILKRAKELNIQFNPETFIYKQKEINYLGMIFNENGMKIDSERAKAIKKTKKS